MARKLVAYFSATGVTARVAELLSDTIGADLYSIEPKEPYTKADLDWTDKTSRSTIEMNNPASRPSIREERDNMKDYDTIFVGFPIWWYVHQQSSIHFLKAMIYQEKQSFHLQLPVVAGWEKQTRTYYRAALVRLF